MKYSVYLRTAMEFNSRTTVAVHGDIWRRDRRGITVITDKDKHFVPWDNIAYTKETR